jgi:DNA-binding SARP family transcriptional activator
VLDPEHRHRADWIIGADRDTVGIDMQRLDVDVERFLEEADAGLAAARAGRTDEALARLQAAETIYRGDFLADDPYQDWAGGMREEARNLYIAVGHQLARLAGERSDHATAAMLLRRVLAHDPYDERAHLGLAAALVAAGRPGDARRAYAAYLGRMEELGAEAAAFPA